MNFKMEVRWMYLASAWFVFAMRRDAFAAYMNGFDPAALSSTALEKTIDAWVEIPLSIPFPFYNKLYTNIFVNEDGVLTLGAPVPAAVPGSVSLPIYDRDFEGTANTEIEQMVIIAPFWEEVNTVLGSTGTVYYRSGLTRSSQALLDAEGIVKSCYIDQEEFTATAGLVATWDLVSNEDLTKQNSFQAILVYDRFHSFVIYYYSDMQYDLSKFSAVGFNAGDIDGGLEFPYSVFSNLPEGSNCGNLGIKGAYVFRVDTEELTSPGCDVIVDHYAIQVSPASGPMMGGNEISIAPNCDLTDSAVCVFQQGDAVVQTVLEVQIVDLVVICIPDPFFVAGGVSIMLYRTIEDAEDPDVTALYTVKYTIEHPDDSTVGVSRLSPTSDAWNTDGSRMTITWDATLFTSHSADTDPPNDLLPLLRISIMQYDESEAGQIPTWDDVYDLGVNVDNSGSFSFTPQALENITEVNPWGVIRVQSKDIYPVSLYSDIHMLGYLLHQVYQDDPVLWAGDECERWNAEEDQSNDADGMPSFLVNVPPCPCTLAQAETDTGAFNQQRGGCALNANDHSCTRQPDSDRVCFLSTKSRAGAECCYDSVNGYIVFALDDPTGGSSDKAGILGMAPYALPGQTPYLSHWVVDVVPYQLCCRWAEAAKCRTYMENRRSKDCSDYKERESAFTFGDPHFITFDQRRYTFNGIGEYRMMEVSDYDFKLHGRTKVATDSGRDEFPVASYLNAVVMQESGSDTIHIELGQIRPLNIFYNHGSGFRQPNMWLTSNAYDPLYLNGATVKVNADFSKIMVAFHASSIVVDVTAYTQSITAEVITSRADIGESVIVSGLLGNLDDLPNNDIRSPEGVIYEGDDPTEMFNTLQDWITVDDSIFHIDGAFQSVDYQNTTFVPTLVTPDPSTLDPLISSRLEEVCQGLQECIFDMSVTQTVVAGQECYDENAAYVSSQTYLAKVETCPYIPGPVDGKVEFSDTLRRYAVGTSVTFSCDDPKSILFGPQTRNCVAQSDPTRGAWSDSTMPVCTVTNCNPDDVKGADVIEIGTDSNGNLRVTFGCPGSTVEYLLTCEGGEWIGGRPDCSTGGGGLSGGAIAGIIIGVLLAVVLLVIVVGYLVRRSGAGDKDLEQTGTKVNENQPAENWGMDQEAVAASAAKRPDSPGELNV